MVSCRDFKRLQKEDTKINFDGRNSFGGSSSNLEWEMPAPKKVAQKIRFLFCVGGVSSYVCKQMCENGIFFYFCNTYLYVARLGFSGLKK